jgi:PAS domain S-box-containing protein
MARPADEEGGRARWPLSAVLTLVIGAVASGVACALAYVYDARRVRHEFERLGDAFGAALGHDLTEQVACLESLRAFWNGSISVERDEFRRFCEPILARHAAIETLAWVERVDSGAGPPRYEVRFVESQLEAAWAPGQDLASDAALRALLDRASAAPRWSALAARADPRMGGPGRFVAALAVRAGAASGDGSIGFAVGLYDLARIVESARARMPEKIAEVEIVDPGAPRGTELLFASAEREPGAVLAASPRKTPSAAGHAAVVEPFAWRVTSSPASGIAIARRGVVPWILLAFGLATSGMLAWYLDALESRRRSLSAANAGLYTEVAERHSIEKELRETQRALATLVSNLPGAAYRCRNDRDWSMEFISDGCIPLTGHAPSEFLRGKVTFGRHLIVEEDRERVWSEVQRALDAQRPYELRYRIRTALGEVKWVWEMGQGVYSRAGELLALEGFIADITVQEQTAERLKREEERLRHEQAFTDAIVASLPGTFYVFDEAGRFLRWNKNVERLTGYGADEVSRMHPLDFIRPADRAAVAAAVAEVFAKGQATVEAELVGKDGTTRPFLFTGYRCLHEGRHVLVGVGTDMSERNQAQRERERLRSMLLEAHELEKVGLLAASVAHDFNNLLTVVMGSAGLALRSVSAGSPAHEFLEQALGASRSASQLTQQILDYSGASGAARPPLELSSAVRDAVELARASLPKRIELALDLAPDLPPLGADAALLRQIVLNLVSNAFEACDTRGTTVRVTTGLAVTTPDDAARAPAKHGRTRAGRSLYVAVADDGEGMDAGTLARAGELFFTTRPAGRGLGLAAVFASVRAHGGWVSIESERGSGTTATVHFPIA